MLRRFFNSGYLKQLFLLFCAIIGQALSYRPASKPAILTPPGFTNAPVYKPEIKDEISGFESFAGDRWPGDFNPAFVNVDPPIPAPTEGPGGPILVISTTTNPFSRYAVEILRAEGLNEFSVTDISNVTASALNGYDVVILGEMTVTPAQVTMLTRWVDAGGNLIVFKPCSLLTPLLGISPAKGTLSDKYLLVNTISGPGAGIVNETIQFHGTANLHTLSGAINLATLYSSASDATIYPAITTMNVGANGGRAIAFTYDLARSIIYTRQGNPAWAGQKRDRERDPIRPDDLFYPDWIDFNKIAIPQADEQQRLLANIILQGNLHRKPLPRFWYLPAGLKAAIIMTGDNHINSGTTARFYQYLTLGPNSAQDVADWKAVRATSFIYPDRPITNDQAVFFQEQGFEISLHMNTGCIDYTTESLQNDFTRQLLRFAISYPGVSAPVTNRSHCLNWSDWSSTPKIELQKGIRLDATYYYWPQTWTQNRPGMFTGSGMPMRFADSDGSLIDVYQMPTQMTDETDMSYGVFCDEILDKAIGAEGYYGAFCANMHTDYHSSAGSDAIIASAQARQVPIISAKQMLTWLDGRNNSSFGNMTWRNNQLSFSITARSGANNLRAMLPLYSDNGQLISITRNGSSIPFTTQIIKGIRYAFFAPVAGTSMYTAAYSSKKVTPAKDQQTSAKRMPSETSSAGKLYVNIMPNPSINYFNVVISSNDINFVKVRILDISGRVVERYENIPSTAILRLGSTWRTGNYFAEVIQGSRRQVVKMIKIN